MQQYRPDIDGLRAIAVIAVVAFHTLPHRFPGGFVGVDVFFVISGFLISSIILAELRSDKFSLSHFYIRRIRRLFPALIIVLAGCWVLGWFLLEPRAYANLGANMLASAGFVSNIFLYSQSGYFEAVSGVSPLLHLWSLGVEEQFYIFWPLALYYLASGSTKKNINFKFVLLLGISFVVNVVGVTPHPIASFYLPFGRVWELLTGALLADVLARHPEKCDYWQNRLVLRNGAVQIKYSDLLSFAGIGLIVAGFFLINEQRAFPGYWALMPVLGAAGVIFSGSEAWPNKLLLSSKWLVALGLISYPLYLTHWPLLVFSGMIDSMRSHDKLRIIIVVVSSVSVSSLIYIFIEKPARTARGMVAKWWVRILLILMSLVMVLAVCTTVNGFVDRYPSAARQFLTFTHDFKESFRNSTCLLSGAEKVFSNDCWQNRSGPQLLIWGDSHGAMLYQALFQVADLRGYGVTQYTSSSCPPFLDFDKKNRPLCRELNTATWDRLTKIRPEVVLLAHDWVQSSMEDILEKLPETVVKLRSLGVDRIVLVGPVPRWTQSLPSSLAKTMRLTDSQVVPARLFDGANQRYGIKNLDDKLSVAAQTLKIEYISPYKTFCTDDGCEVWLEDKFKQTRELTSFDDAHLMPLAAQFLISKNLTLFFNEFGN